MLNTKLAMAMTSSRPGTLPVTGTVTEKVPLARQEQEPQLPGLSKRFRIAGDAKKVGGGPTKHEILHTRIIAF